MAVRLACDLAARGLVIFSGLARGMDAASHRGAVAAKGKPAAVSGTGVDVIFAAPQNFPIRNRIISGISMGVLVVEAAEYSRTRITARCALEQNREVFAVPGNVTTRTPGDPTSSSSRALSSPPPGKTFGKNSRQTYDLH